MYLRGQYKLDVGGIKTSTIFDNNSLYKYLIENKFSYPDLKHIRQGENGKVVLEGKYTSHYVIIEEELLKLEVKNKWGTQREANGFHEDKVLKIYLEKFFDKNSSADPYDEYIKFKRVRKQPYIIYGLIILATISFVGYVFLVEPSIRSNNISESYLTQYSSKYRIGETFDNFFASGKWKKYNIGSKEYVDFKGICTQNNKDVNAIITFSVSGEAFKVEKISVANEDFNDLEIVAFLYKIYEAMDDKSNSETNTNTNNNSANNIKDNVVKEEVIKETVDSEIKIDFKNTKYIKYTNSRFGFSIEYPDFLEMQEAPTNDDGRIFISKDKNIKLVVSGYNNVLNDTVNSLYNDDINKLINIGYKSISERSYVVTWRDGDIMKYKSVVVGIDKINNFTVEYNKKYDNDMNIITGEIYNSFMPGSL
ncbi:MAG: hypothetical protein ACRC68_17345, partial [Clostridium sp.]